MAPELPSHENFVADWKSVTNYFIDTTGNALNSNWWNVNSSGCRLHQTFSLSYILDDKMPVESTNIPYSLEHMLETLRSEDEENGGSTAVCSLWPQK